MKTLLIAATLLTLSSLSFAQESKVAIKQTWKGSVDDDVLEKTALTAIYTQKTLDATWELWKQPGKAPQVDFAKDIVVVTTSSGSIVNLIVQKKGNDLRVSGFGTRDLRPGFRFVMGTVSREGIASVNGVAIPKE